MMDEKSLITTIDAFLSGDISAKAPEDNALGERINRLFDLVADETAMIQKREAEFQKAFVYIRRVVAKLTQDDLFENRIDTGLLPAGLRPVGQAFNALLDKIQELIKAQKKAIEELDSAKANIEYERTYWQEIFESSQTGMAVFDPEGRVWEANEAITEMFGYSKDEVFSPHFSWGNIIAPEDLSLAMERLKDLLQTGRAQKFELTYVHKNGKKVPTLISYQKLTKRPEWQTDRMIASIQDITEIKAQQQTIKELSTPLIPVWTKVLMVPLLGSFDSMRMHDLSERLLEEVASKKPRAVLLDLSGLAFVDTQVVSEILRLVTSVRLLGARTILSGIGPTVAQSLVRLGANLDGIATYATLEQALRNVVGEVGHARR